MVTGKMRIRRAGADLEVGGEGLAPIGAKSTPELRVVVGDAIGIARPAGAEVGARVVPDYGQVAGGLVQRDLRHKLAVGGMVVVDAYTVAPGSAVVVRIAHVNIHVVALVGTLLGINQVDAAI